MAKKKIVKRAAGKRPPAPTPAPVRVKPGPRKKLADGPPQYTTHKVRAAWFKARASYPVREAKDEKLISERARVRPAVPSAVSWAPVGPANIGGRCTALAVHPTNADIVYIGSAGGGVWRSDDAGKTWASQWHDQPVLNVGSLAIDPRSPNTVYCG